MSKCLEKKVDLRLGSNDGVNDILSHDWFKSIDIEAIKNKTMEAEYIPNISDDPLDVTNFDEDITKQAVRPTILETKDLEYI